MPSPTPSISNLPYDASKPKANDSCQQSGEWILGYNQNKVLIYLSCGPDGRLHPESVAPQLDQTTGHPLRDTSANSSVLSFSNRCQLDPQVPVEWAQAELLIAKSGMCTGPLRYVQGSTNFASPLVTLSPDSAYLNINSCKISDPVGRQFLDYATFANGARPFNPVKSSVIQVVPIQFTDYTANTDPQSDYGKYFKFVDDFIANSSDVPITSTHKVPSQYIQIGKPLSAYPGLGIEHSQTGSFIQDVQAAVMGKIDFSGANQVLIVGPPDVPETLLDNHMGFQESFSSPTGRISSVYLEGPNALVAMSNFLYSVDPWITVHEEVGHQMGLDDTYGAEDYPSKYNGTLINPDDYGTGNWGNMAGTYGEFLLFQKWLVGFEFDSQMRCASSTQPSITWLRPSSTKGNFQKGLVIPLSSTKAIVIESERATGYNFKLPASQTGALVYTVDMAQLYQGNGKSAYGITVQMPTTRPGFRLVNSMLLGDAALKQGESVIVGKVKITVVEAGEFGDVIKVEPVA